MSVVLRFQTTEVIPTRTDNFFVKVV